MTKFLVIFFLKIVSTQFKFAYKGYTIATIGNFFEQRDHQHIKGNIDENVPVLTQEFFADKTSVVESGDKADLWEKKPTFKSKNSNFGAIISFLLSTVGVAKRD